MSWEVDWTHPENNGSKVWARNPASHIPRARKWHLVTTGHLRDCGINTPKNRRDSWEVDWSQREGKKVWARNLESKMPSARVWHWVDYHTLNKSGVTWMSKNEKTGRGLNTHGYVIFYRRGLVTEEIALAEKHGLFLGKKKQYLMEHRLVALKKYGTLPKGIVVRHINGVKTDNRPENLVLGTHSENCRDHDTARIEAMQWRERAERAEQEAQALKQKLKDVRRTLRGLLNHVERAA